MRRSNTSKRSSRCDPPISSPTLGTTTEGRMDHVRRMME
jgi:hypothetical protein